MRKGLYASPDEAMRNLYGNNQPVMSSYTPTLSERAANWLNNTFYGDNREGQQRADKVVDFLNTVTPFGIATTAYDAGRMGAEGYLAGDPYRMAGGVGLGALALAPVGIGKTLERSMGSAGADEAGSLASRGISLYNTPVTEARNFLEDYPNGLPTDALGRLTHDIDGRPLTGRYVVGRTQAGGSDVALPGEAYDPVATVGTGQGVLALSPRELGKDTGQYRKTRLTDSEWQSFKPWEREESDGYRRSIGIRDDLSDDDLARASLHELGHMIDDRAGQGYQGRHGPVQFRSIPGFNQSELDVIYDDLNRPKDWSGTGLFTPKDKGYPKKEWAAEYAAEAFRAYMTDPNYMKTVARDTAAAIRKAVNNHPVLSKTIQFNSLAIPGAAGLYGAAATPQQNQPAQPVY